MWDIVSIDHSVENSRDPSAFQADGDPTLSKVLSVGCFNEAGAADSCRVKKEKGKDFANSPLSYISAALGLFWGLLLC